MPLVTWVRSACSGAGFDLVVRFGILNSVSLCRYGVMPVVRKV
jgi:hypothetical protein